MIFVGRPKTKPESLRRKDGKAAKERVDVFAFFDGRKRAAKYPGEFKAYKGPDVVETLNRIFYQKCAYCESPYKATQPVDVEHYRPKNAVLDEETRKIKYPGYPWLAFEWSNLLPSCIDCNRQREQEIKDGSRVLGKANRFPLTSEKLRATRPGAEKKEKPLLLNPCRDKVQNYFIYDENGFVAPRPKSGLAYQRANATIDVCGLHRKNLVDSRAAHLRKIEGIIEILREHIRMMNRNPGMIGGMEQFDRIVEHLRSFLTPDQPYTALARQFIEPVIAEATS